MRKTIEHAHAQLTVVIVAPPEHAGQAASDADHVKVPNTDFITVLCTRMSSIGPPSFRESNRTARRHGGFRKPLDQLWKRLVARRALQKVGVRRCAGRPLGRVIHGRAKGSENGRSTYVDLDRLGVKDDITE